MERSGSKTSSISDTLTPLRDELLTCKAINATAKKVPGFRLVLSLTTALACLKMRFSSVYRDIQSNEHIGQQTEKCAFYLASQLRG